MLTVFNVKQGDSMLLEGMTRTSCCFDDEPLLIDCGLQKAAVHSMIGSMKKRLRVLITHADRDHIGGLHDVLANHHVTRLYVPRYLPEILRIENYLRKKAARKITRLPVISTGRRIEVAEGDRLCSHSTVMNPPKIAAEVLNRLGVDSVSTGELQAAVAALQSLGLELDVADIMEYTPEPIGFTSDVDGTQQIQSTQASRNRQRRIFFQGFFVHLAQSLQGATGASSQFDAPVRDNFEPTGNPGVDQAISAALQLAANQVSIVFRYVGTTSFLFTGDADTSVFRRMVSRGHPLQAMYLKVPHHGSRHNLDNSALVSIAPKIAVVSHDNAKFAGDPDSHPHIATINLLKAHGVTTYYTNDVRKANKVIASATAGKTPCKYLDFK